METFRKSLLIALSVGRVQPRWEYWCVTWLCLVLNTNAALETAGSVIGGINMLLAAYQIVRVIEHHKAKRAARIEHERVAMDHIGSLPPMPQNVRIEHPDGTVTPCEMRYVGLDDEGIHMWETTAPVLFRMGLDRLKAEILPAKTGIAWVGTTE